MPAGLQVWDAAGNMTLDISDYLGRIIGSFEANALSGSHSDSRLLIGEGFVVPDMQFSTSGGLGLNSVVTLPNCVISGGVINWTRVQVRTDPLPYCIIYYGVY